MFSKAEVKDAAKFSVEDSLPTNIKELSGLSNKGILNLIKLIVVACCTMITIQTALDS